MNPQHRNIIRRNYVELAQQMQGDVDTVCKILFQKRIISRNMEENISESNCTEYEKATNLLDLIVRRGPHAFDAFHDSLKAAELDAAAYLLIPPQQSFVENHGKMEIAV